MIIIIVVVRDVGEFLLVYAILKKWAHLSSVILCVSVDQVITANQGTQGNER